MYSDIRQMTEKYEVASLTDRSTYLSLMYVYVCICEECIFLFDKKQKKKPLR